jgi:hypothetical protein
MKVRYKNKNSYEDIYEEIYVKLATNMAVDQSLIADKEQEFHDFIREILVTFNKFF